jgi:hypothetical protein
MAKIKFNKDKKIAKDKIFKEKYPDYKDYVVPKQKGNRVLCVILRENKNALFKWVDLRVTKFSSYGNCYFMFPEAVHVTDNSILCAIYLEGISLPISGANIERKTEKRKYKDMEGIEHEIDVTMIKGLRFDSKVADIVLSRNLIDVLASVRPDKWLFFTFIMLVAVLVTSIIGIVISYVFR